MNYFISCLQIDVFDIDTRLWQSVVTRPCSRSGRYNRLSANASKLLSSLTHLSLASHKRDTGEQCKPRSDAAEHGI